MMHHVKRLAKKKSVIGLLSLFAVSGTVYGVESFKPAEPVRYVLAAAERGTLIVSVSGSGQVSGQSQVDVKPSVSASVTKVLVKPGAAVKAGEALFELDQKAALKSVRDASLSVHDAQLSVASAQLSLEKLQKGAEGTALLQAQDRVNAAKRALEKVEQGVDAVDIKAAERELEVQLENARISSDGKTPQVVRDAYDDAVAAIVSAAQTAQDGLEDADEVLGIDNSNRNDSYESLLSVLDSGALMQANTDYAAARPAVRAFVASANAMQTYDENPATVEAALAEAQSKLDNLDDLLLSVDRVLGATVTSPSFSQSSLSSLRSGIQGDRSSLATKLSSVSAQSQAITQAKASYLSSEISVEKARASLDDLKRGPDPHDVAAAEENLQEAQASYDELLQGADTLDLKSSQNALAQRRSSLASAANRLNDARETLRDYTVRAAFDGILANVEVSVGDQASPSTVLGTLLTEGKMAQMTLNEVDAIRVKTAQKATLTFDAVPDLTIAGVVSEVDTVGTVTQGVVGYDVKITFLTDDERIKPGMSVAASIVTDMKQDALLVPAAALQKSGETSGVLRFSGPTSPAPDGQGVVSDNPPTLQPVQTGLSNDQMVEVTEGLAEGDQIVVRTINPAATQAGAPATGSAIRLPGVSSFGGAGGNATFIRGTR